MSKLDPTILIGLTAVGLLAVLIVISVFALVANYRNHSAIREVVMATDGMKDQLIAAVKESYYARGRKDQKDAVPEAPTLDRLKTVSDRMDESEPTEKDIQKEKK